MEFIKRDSEFIDLALRQLGQRLRAFRQRRRLSQEYVAGQMDVSKMTISNWERGVSGPSAIQLMQLSRLFGVSMEFFNTIPA